MKLILRITLITIMLFTVSCTYRYLYEELAHIHKGMNLEEVADVINNDNFGKGLDQISENVNDDLFTLKDDSKILITEKYSPIGTQFYVFMFKEDRLLYWGLPYKFMNSTNSSIKEASIEISTILNEEYTE